MTCVRNISIPHALSYFDDDILRKEARGFDYYSQEDNGIWFGRTAERLGLTEKSFSRKDYHAMMNGRFSYLDRKTNKTIAIDLAKHSPSGKHQAGVELTLSAPKSVSIMSEVFGDRNVLDAHLKAVNSTLEYIQDNLIYTRSSVNGRMKLDRVDNLIAIRFTHHSSRNQDPQLHSHIPILNLTIDRNGKIKTNECAMLFNNDRFIRELYHQELAHNLRQLGYNVSYAKKLTQFAPEIGGVPEELMNLFSSRRQ